MRHNPLPITSYQLRLPLLITEYLSPLTSYFPLLTVYRLQITDYPLTDYLLLSPSYLLPITRSLITEYLLLFTSYRLPTTDY